MRGKQLNSQSHAATGTDGPSTGRQAPESAQEMVPTMVPRGPENGAHIGAIRLASQTYQSASDCTETAAERNKNGDPKIATTLNDGRRSCAEAGRSAAVTINQEVDRQ